MLTREGIYIAYTGSVLLADLNFQRPARGEVVLQQSQSGRPHSRGIRTAGRQSSHQPRRRPVEAILDTLDFLPFGVPVDAEYANIRVELEASGKPIRPNDLLIAAHARSLGTTIVTANANEFSRVRGLNVENWLD